MDVRAWAGVFRNGEDVATSCDDGTSRFDIDVVSVEEDCDRHRRDRSVAADGPGRLRDVARKVGQAYRRQACDRRYSTCGRRAV